MPSTAKRKAGISVGSEPPQKKPRNSTLDSFFSPQVPVPKKNSDGPDRPSHVALNPEQTRVLRMVIDEEKNVFFTGAAGTGKSLLLRAIISALRKKYAKSKDAISITASTGMGASNIGGMTIHSWGAVTPNCNNMQLLIKCIKTCRPALQRWKKTKVLIIDEISMVDGQLFQQLHDLAVELRKKTEKPFGGIQIVVTGDFFQLPPVTKSNQEPIFAFESPAWQSTLENTFNLTHVFRQKDCSFISALNALRLGAPTDEAATLFNSLSRPLPTPTELFPLRAQVARANTSRLNALPTHRVPYVARDSGSRPKLLDNLLAEEKLELKVDAQVMLIKNIDEVLVNGVVGRVLGFYHPNQLVSGTPPQFSVSDVLQSTKPLSTSTSSRASTSSSSGKAPASFKSPTETKKNGALLRYIQLSEDGRTPVIISGADNKENTTVKREIKPNSKQKEKAAESEDRYPLVLFEYLLQDGKHGFEAVLIKRDEFKVEDAEGKLLARRVQLPLILAWAMSIHKSQGQTIHRVKVDLTHVFEKGQAYVALSRASSLEGLQVVGFNPRKVIAHHKVIKWNKTLEEADSI